jgi:signal transduction histidine kinase
MLGPVSVARMLDEIAREIEPLVPPSVRFAYTNGVGDDVVTTDGGKLKTVVKNLVGNALKFTSAGEVTVDARGDGDFLVVAVRDTGIGIAPEHLPVIFEMFRQVDGSATRHAAASAWASHRQAARDVARRHDRRRQHGRRGPTFTVAIPVGRATRQRATGT